MSSEVEAWEPFDRHEAVGWLHSAGSLFAMVITGGGFEAVTDLLTRPGASRTVHHIEIPYHQAAVGRLLPSEEGPAVSSAVAAELAVGARHRLLADLRSSPNADGARFFGLGATAALATDRERRGTSHAWVAVIGSEAEHWAHLQLPTATGATPRQAQDRLVSDLILWMMVRAVAPGRFPRPTLGPGTSLTTGPPPS